MTQPAPAPPALDPVRWLNNQPYLLLSLTSLFWAGNIVLARHVAGHVPPLTLSCVRWIGTFLILLPFAWPHLNSPDRFIRYAARLAIERNPVEQWQSKALAETKPAENGGVLITRQAVPQSAVTFGQVGPKRDDPDWYAARLVNEVLGGGGFRGRLMREIREKRGLAYGVSTELVSFRHAGLILGNVATENARVAQSIALIRAEWRRMRDEGPSEAELDRAKEFLIGSFPLSLDTSARVASFSNC